MLRGGRGNSRSRFERFYAVFRRYSLNAHQLTRELSPACTSDLKVEDLDSLLIILNFFKKDFFSL